MNISYQLFFYSDVRANMIPDASFASEGSLPLEKENFTFHCHPDVPCFLFCCHNVNLHLFPYDIIKLKNTLGIRSWEFLEQYARVVEGSHPYFPGLMLQMKNTDRFPCPFLVSEGCSVYKNRPSACRTYPLERGVEKSPGSSALQSQYFLSQHSYCKGHLEERSYSIKQWERDQGLHEFNLQNDLWAEVDAFFATNPWQGEGKAGPLQQLAFMVCYNIDAFRSYVAEHNLLAQFQLNKDQRRRIGKFDDELLKFGYQWLLFTLGGKQTLQRKSR